MVKIIHFNDIIFFPYFSLEKFLDILIKVINVIYKSGCKVDLPLQNLYTVRT